MNSPPEYSYRSLSTDLHIHLMSLSTIQYPRFPVASNSWAPLMLIIRHRSSGISFMNYKPVWGSICKRDPGRFHNLVLFICGFECGPAFWWFFLFVLYFFCGFSFVNEFFYVIFVKMVLYLIILRGILL